MEKPRSFAWSAPPARCRRGRGRCSRRTATTALRYNACRARRRHSTLAADDDRHFRVVIGGHTREVHPEMALGLLLERAVLGPYCLFGARHCSPRKSVCRFVQPYRPPTRSTIIRTGRHVRMHLSDRPNRVSRGSSTITAWQRPAAGPDPRDRQPLADVGAGDWPLAAQRDVIALDLPGSPPRRCRRPVRRQACFADAAGPRVPRRARPRSAPRRRQPLGRLLASSSRNRAASCRRPAFRRPASTTTRGRVRPAFAEDHRAHLASARAPGRRLTASPLVRTLTFSQVVASPGCWAPPTPPPRCRRLPTRPGWTTRSPQSPTTALRGGEAIQVPVTIAWGPRIGCCCHARTRAGRMIPGARLVMLTGCGHVPTYDDPEQVARVLLDGRRG